MSADLPPSPASTSPDATLLLNAAAAGGEAGRAAAAELLPLVYEQLRCAAREKMARERGGAGGAGQTLSATALVHEAYLRLVGPQVEGGMERGVWDGRGHFYGAAAEAMRRILVERARRRRRVRHGGGHGKSELDPDEIIAAPPDDELLDVHSALERLAAAEPQKAELVKLRYFAGLTLEEAAAAMGVSRATADRWWGYARAWLFKAIEGSGDEGSRDEGSRDRGGRQIRDSG